VVVVILLGDNMTTKNVVPNADSEGNVGTSSLKWLGVNANTINELTLTKQTTGFTIAGGTTSKTLTVDGDASVSGTNTGDQDLSSYITADEALELSLVLGG
jgi:hypothetical protein